MLKFAEPQGARPRLRARLPAARPARRCRKSRGITVEPAAATSDMGLNPEWVRYYLAAKLNDARRGPRLQSRRLPRAVNSDLVGKYVNIASRAAGFIGKRFAASSPRSRCRPAASSSTRCRGAPAAPARPRRRPGARRSCSRCAAADAIAADYEARVQQGDPPGHVPRRPREPVRGRAEAVEIAKEAGPGRRAAMVLHALPRALPHPHDLPEAGAAEGGRGRRGVPRASEAARLGGRGHAAQARPRGPAVPAPRLAHRSQADRRSCSSRPRRRSPRLAKAAPPATRPSSSWSPWSRRSRR